MISGHMGNFFNAFSDAQKNGNTDEFREPGYDHWWLEIALANGLNLLGSKNIVNGRALLQPRLIHYRCSYMAKWILPAVREAHGHNKTKEIGWQIANGK